MSDWYQISIINEGSGRITESIDAKYINISIYSPLLKNQYFVKLRNSVKGLINIKNDNNNCVFAVISDI